MEAKLPSDIDRKKLGEEVLNEAVGLGPLETLLADDSVTEIMVNKYDHLLGYLALLWLAACILLYYRYAFSIRNTND